MEMTAEQKLWTAVVSQAFHDAFPPTYFTNKMRKQDRNAYTMTVSQAHNWFSLGNRDFVEICQLAGLEPGYVIRLYNERKNGTKTTSLLRGAVHRMACVLLLVLPLAACATQEPAQVGRIMIPDVKACLAEYEPKGFVGTQAEYDAGCYQFANVRF
jgi:hypothetical protein